MPGRIHGKQGIAVRRLCRSSLFWGDAYAGDIVLVRTAGSAVRLFFGIFAFHVHGSFFCMDAWLFFLPL